MLLLFFAFQFMLETEVCAQASVGSLTERCICTQGLDNLTNLRILSIQSNRLTRISGLDALTQLEELHISHNSLTCLSGLDSCAQLRVLDISSNPIEHLEGLKQLVQLEELWASQCRLDDFAEIERELADKEQLNTVYFEGNPLQLRQPVLYRNKVRLALPRVKQIDASKSFPSGGSSRSTSG